MAPKFEGEKPSLDIILLKIIELFLSTFCKYFIYIKNPWSPSNGWRSLKP
jgi:hypothetical protein